jgi:hypothetical protein
MIRQYNSKRVDGRVTEDFKGITTSVLVASAKVLGRSGKALISHTRVWLIRALPRLVLGLPRRSTSGKDI